MQQQKLSSAQPEFQTNSSPESPLLPHPTITLLEKHPKIKPILRIYRQWGDTATLKTRKHQISSPNALSAYPRGQRLNFDGDLLTLEKTVRALKPLHQTSKTRYQFSQPPVAAGRLLNLIMKCFPSLLVLDIKSYFFWWNNKECCRVLFKILASFKRPAHFSLMLSDSDSLEAQLKCLKQLRVFKDLSLDIDNGDVASKKSFIPSYIAKLRHLQELCLRMWNAKGEADKFLCNLALALPKF